MRTKDQRPKTKDKNQKSLRSSVFGLQSCCDGFSLLEFITVMIIMALTAGLGYPALRAGIVNREAKQALQTGRSIAHAVKMYNLDTGNYPSANLQELYNGGYVNLTEISESDQYNFAFQPNGGNPSQWKVVVTSKDGARTLGLQNNGSSFIVTDSAGLYQK